ncbi:MAG: SHOCT domain-containing protein [Armatimonadota bacterium]
MYGDHMFGGGWLMMIIITIFWLLILAGIVILVIWLVNRNKTPGAGENALDILNKRYARGEINREEYERMKQDIS